MKIKYFLVTLTVMTTAFYSAVLFFSPGTVQWNGSADTNWDNVSNWTVMSGSPSIPPNKGETGDHVVIANGVPNFPEIIAPAFARSLTVNAGAKVTVKTGNTLKVIGSDLDGVTNDGLIIVESGGLFEIDSAFDDGLINHLGAKLVNNGSFSIRNGNGSRVENADSIINNAGANFNVYFGLDTALINFKTGVIKNFATFNVQGGSNAQVSNYGKIINEAGNFSVTGGLGGTIFTNQLTGYLYNAGAFSSGNGNNGVRLDNYNTIDNNGTFTIDGAALGNGFINRSKAIFNHLAGTCTISNGNGTQIDNNGVINIHSNIEVKGGGGMNMPTIINGIGDTINHFAGTFSISLGNYTQLDNSGVVNLYVATTISGGNSTAVKNNATGIINNFSGLFAIQSGGGEKLVNDGTVYLNDDAIFSGGPIGIVINNSGAKMYQVKGSLTIQNYASNPGFKNDGIFYGGISNSILIQTGGGVGLENNGIFIDSTGGSFSWNSLAGDVIKNTNYFFMDEAISQTGNGTQGWLINNSDSAIFGPNTLITSMNTTKFVNNGANAYLENNGGWLFSFGTNPIINAGHTYFSPSSSMKGQQVGGNIITNTGRFVQEGNIVYREFAGSILQNDNFFLNAGTLKSSKWGTALTNNDTIINTGVIDLDTISNNAIVNNSYFLNDTTGKMYGDFFGTNGIVNNTGAKIKNAGEIWMARDTGVARFGISNSGTFDNFALINIGKKGPLFGGGIENTSSGIFNNINKGEIFIYNLVKSPSIPYGIKNDGNFYNTCSYIETQGPILDNNNFVNSGIIYKVPDTITANSNIAVNNKYVFNGDVDPFNIGSNNGHLFNTNCGTAVPSDQLLALLTDCDPIDCSLYTSGKIFVDSSATGANNGSNWTDAFNSLQDALSHARICSVDTILVAQGTYYSSEPILDACGDEFGLDSTISFNISDSMVLLGGYPTGGGTLNLSSIDDPLRDPLCNKTILSGDIQQDGNLANNSYHVLTTFGVSNATIIDGFCITQGNAVFLDPQGFPTLRNVGGGLLNSAFDPMTLDDMALPGISNPRIINCIFFENHALVGAGVANVGIFGTASPDLVDCAFYSDSAILGGGIANLGYDGESSPHIIRNKVQGNTALAAGGILNIAGSIVGVMGPIAPTRGSLRSASKMPTQLSEAFEKSGLITMMTSMNHHMPQIPPAGQVGTAASIFPALIPGFGVSSPLIKNGLITGNGALAGGGIVNYVLNFSQHGGGEVSPQIINTTLAVNVAALGGGMINSDEGFVNDETGLVKPCIANSIFWNNIGFTDNSTNDMFNNFNGSSPFADTIKFHHNISQSDYATLTSIVVSPHLIDTSLAGNKYGLDPLFVDVPIPIDFTTLAGDYHLTGTSPAINMGDNTSCADSVDLDHKIRIARNIIDIGPYEFLLHCDSLTIYVQADGTVPFVPLDSLVDTLATPCLFYVNGVLNTTGIQLQCTDTGANNFDLLLTRVTCAGEQTLNACPKVITLLDTFSKRLTAISQLNVSLDANCMFFLTPYDVLANFKGCSNDFEVHIQYPFGTNHYVPDYKLDFSHLGYCMVYSVVQKSTGNTTWGKICVEDKFPPQVGDTVEYRTCFQFAQLPSGPSYKVADNCSDSAIVNIVSENFTDYGCDSALYQGLVTRHLIATDVWGNQSNLTKKIYILKVSLDSVVCARDTAVDCSLEVVNGVRITDPKRSGAPQVKIGGKLVSLWPNNPSCKLEVLYRDERQDVCGTSYKVLRTWVITDWCSKPAGQEKTCKQWIEVKDTTSPVVYDTILPLYFSSPHDCGQYVDLPVLRYSDCNTITETYLLKYYEEGILRILSGKLPASHIWLPTGIDSVEVNVVDACNNIGKGKIYINIIDNTPPTPVCDEYTQVTVDPTSCWSAVAAADLDNGSHDNCCSVLHFAAAKMDSIVYWRNYWNTRLETEVGKTEFWRDKAGYDALIEDWINCYVFSDTVHFDECGTNQVVLRVYEACGIPRLDPHVWPCSPHAWFCYNTYLYIGDFNYNWFDPKGPHSCQYRPDLTSLSKVAIKYDSYFDKGYLNPKFIGSAQYNFCNVPFYFGQLGNISKFPPNGGYCSARLYNDCMVNVLVDDKQAPTVDHLEDVTVYCDGAPDWADYPMCDDMYPSYPGELRDSKSIVHGYYGGSNQYDVHMGTGDHNDPQACDQNRGWAPIYCKNWLYLDSFDRGGKVNLSDYFEKPVLVDKKRPLDHTLKANEFTFTDNCRLDDASLTVTNNGTINGCGEGWISRTWTIKDKCGNAVSATQKIIVKHRSDFEVIFPADKKVTCDFLNRTDTSELGAGKPKLSDDDCEQLGVTYKDEIFTIVDSACYKIVRTWTIIDWCLYNPNQQKRYPDVIVNDSLRANTTDRACVYRSLKDNNDGYIQYVQIIKVIDELKPHITNCSDQTVCIDKDCATAVNIPLSGTDNCSDQIRFRADITRPDGTHDKRSDITAITGSGFTAGAYKIQVIAKDQCGNEDTCNFTLTIKDCKKPTPYCLNGIAIVVMPSTGSVQVWAKDFDKGASDNCTEASKLKFSFTKNTADAGKVLTCANIPNGKEQPINVEVWVTDEAGNQDFCSTYILLQDNGDGSKPGGACADTAALVANVTGKLLTEEKEGVEFANVDVKGMQGMPSIVTSTDGSYSFSSIPMNTDHISIKALRDDNPMNGVSTLDLVLIQKHILGTEYLKSPYKMIAADVDNSNDISAIDLLELRKLILGLYDKLPNNTSWKFIPKSYTFSDPSNPWSYPTEDVLTDMSEKMIRDFVGVKIGDVNSTAAAHNLMGTEIRSGETGLIFEVQDQVFKAGDKVSVEFRSPNFNGVSGFQGTLSTSYEESSRKPQTTPSGAGGRNGIQTLKFESISSSMSLKVSENNIGRRWEHEGMVTMSWNTNTSMDLKDDAALFTMHFTAQSAGRLSDVLRVGSQHTIAESYEGKGELGNLSIRFVGKDGKEVAGKSELYQNYPNPFDQRTVIGLNLAEGVKGNLKITDVAGRAVKTISKAWSKGYNEIWLNRSELQPTGILFYSFESKDFTATKRMILIQ